MFYERWQYFQNTILTTANIGKVTGECTSLVANFITSNDGNGMLTLPQTSFIYINKGLEKGTPISSINTHGLIIDVKLYFRNTKLRCGNSSE